MTEIADLQFRDQLLPGCCKADIRPFTESIRFYSGFHFRCSYLISQSPGTRDVIYLLTKS